MGKGKRLAVNNNLTITTVGARPLRPGENRYSHWSELASCVGKFDDFSKTTSVKYAPPGVRTEKDLLAYNKTKFHKAAEICLACPVLGECEKDSTPEDYEADMVRAGRIPAGFGNPRGRPQGRRGLSPGITRDKECGRGHDGYWVLRGGYYRCRKCASDRDYARDHGLRYDPIPTVDVTSPCPAGHMEWSTTGKQTRCLACRRVKRQSAKMEEC